MLPTFGEPFILETDSSDTGLVVVLSQRIDGNVRVVAFASREVEKDMKNYSSKKLELLAVVWAVSDKCRHYLIGTQ